MKLVMTLLVRNEIDVIAANIDFHLSRGVDFIIATDNASNDGTTDVLRSYEAKGALHYILETDDNYAQHAWVTRMARLAAVEYSADWVINNDADEFWWPDTGGGLKQVLAAIPDDCAAISADRTNFIPAAGTGVDCFFADAMRIRTKYSFNDLGMPLPAKVAHRASANVDVSQGNHAVCLNGNVVEAPSGSISILHFPTRTFEQVDQKICAGGAAYERNAEIPRHIGATWRALYALRQKGLLREWYDELLLSPGGIAEGIKCGSLIYDDRLFLALKALGYPKSRSNEEVGYS